VNVLDIAALAIVERAVGFVGEQIGKAETALSGCAS